MEIQFLGAARTVTGSMHLLRVNGSQILLDCGLFQGRREESRERNKKLPFEPGGIDVLALSHAHIDHSGNIPTLVKEGFKGSILTTSPTRDLCSAMLRDAGHIQEEDAEYVNKKRDRQGLPPVEPLYTVEDATQSLTHFVSVSYGRPMSLAPGVTVTFCDAGHILGSSVVVLDVEETGSKKRILFSGDLGRKGVPILRDPQVVEGVDYLIIESTYGDRLHDPVELMDEELREVILSTYRQGGKVIVPAFAVGRTQDLVYALHRLVRAQRLPDLPIYVDSPLAVNVTEVFRLHPECYDQETRTFMEAGNGLDPFGFGRLNYVRSVEQSKDLNFLREPAIIISASGMAEAGRILHHLKNNIEDRRNTILIVSWQAPHTLGRRLADREQRVKIFGEVYDRKAEVATIGGFSAHAGQDFLLDYCRAVQGQVKEIFLVHGEPRPAGALAEKLKEAGMGMIRYPGMASTYEI